MDTIVCHFWTYSTYDSLTLYEVDYYSYPIREGVLGFAKKSGSGRLCTCSEQELHARLLAAALN